jgi:hypothetical protein
MVTEMVLSLVAAAAQARSVAAVLRVRVVVVLLVQVAAAILVEALVSARRLPIVPRAPLRVVQLLFLF